MRQSTFPPLLASWIANAQEVNTNPTNDVVLRVTVQDVAPLRSFSGAVTPTDHVDPRFALTLRIDACVPALTNLKSGTVVTFAVHSPSLFLGGGAEKGTSHQITMPRKKANNLVVREPAGVENPAATLGDLVDWQVPMLPPPGPEVVPPGA